MSGNEASFESHQQEATISLIISIIASHDIDLEHKN